MTRTASFLPVALALLLISCAGPEAPKTIEETTFAPALGVDLKNSVKTSYGEYYRDITAGGGAAIASGQTITPRYTGWFADGTVFDSSDLHPGAPFTFVLGAGGVIAGWDLGLAGAHVGGVRQLVIPPELAYGAAGWTQAGIPPNAILVFNVTIEAAQ